MSDDRRFERDARAWLEIGPTDAPDRVVQAALIEIDTTSQERDFGVPWRLPIMSMTSRLAAAAVVVVVAVGVAFVFFRPGASDVGSPSPSPQVTAAPTPSQASSVTVNNIANVSGTTPYDLDVSGATSTDACHLTYGRSENEKEAVGRLRHRHCHECAGRMR